jgi:hypothetical protein
MYAEIINNKVEKIHSSLPEAYNNISNLFALNNLQLSDLGWSGNENVKFYEYVPPDICPQNFIVESVSYTIDHEQFKVYGSNNLISIPPPEFITATQIRLWLIENNFSLSNIDNLIQSIEDQKTREKVMAEWEYAPYILRNHPFISVIGSALGLDDNQIDQAFVEASKIGENL